MARVRDPVLLLFFRNVNFVIGFYDFKLITKLNDFFFALNFVKANSSLGIIRL